MRFELQMDCDNAAFDEDIGGAGAEIMAVLNRLITSLLTRGPFHPPCDFPLFDSNGNRIGTARFLE